MQRNPQTHQKPSAFRERCYLGLSGVGKSPKWLRGLDLNQRPLGYEPNELPDCSTPLLDSNNHRGQGQTTRWQLEAKITRIESRNFPAKRIDRDLSV